MEHWSGKIQKGIKHLLNILKARILWYIVNFKVQNAPLKMIIQTAICGLKKIRDNFKKTTISVSQSSNNNK